jgi:hypothetical protein
VTKTLATLVAVAGLFALPSAGQAATTFGSRLLNNPSSSGECTSFPNPCTIASFIHPTDPNGDPNSAGAPVGGVITKFRIRAFGEGGAAATVTFRLADVSRPDPSNQDAAVATLVADGPTVTIPASSEPETPILDFPARVTVKPGNHLALDGTNVWATYDSSGDKFSYVFNPPLVAGQGPRGSASATGELLVAAVIEADADGDGFGDETQDGCPAQSNNQGACDNAGPGISRIALRARSIGYRLTENAAMTFRVQRLRGGRYRSLRGRFTDAGEAGANKRALPRRFRRSRLQPGRYRVLVSGRDQFGNSSQKTKKFRVR